MEISHWKLISSEKEDKQKYVGPLILQLLVIVGSKLVSFIKG